jgi:hypothetical protein
MVEEFLHYIWNLKLFNTLNLTTTKGEKLEIIKSGILNTDAGPDFFNAQIKIGNTKWAGNVEIHVNASDWNKHNHQHDVAYNNVILHVVFNDDVIVNRLSGEAIPTLELKEKIDNKLYERYLNFKESKDWIPCEKQISSTSVLTVNSTIDKLLLERLERKSISIVNSLKLNNYNWEETFYRHLARNFGFNVNAEPFELLAKSIPSVVIAKHKNSLFQIEALLFGQSGLLNEHFKDKYLCDLQNEYVYLKQKFKLNSIDAHLWKFLRLRPVNFPTIRLAQFAGLIYRSSHLFSKIMETENLGTLKLLMNTDVSEYWQTHYVADKSSPEKTKHLGDEAINNIVINTIVPFLFVYGRQKNEEKYIDRALLFLEQIPGEQNAIIKKWKILNMPVNTAYLTQALLQLKNEYCSHKKCLSCAIGNELIKKS